MCWLAYDVLDPCQVALATGTSLACWAWHPQRTRKAVGHSRIRVVFPVRLWILLLIDCQCAREYSMIWAPTLVHVSTASTRRPLTALLSQLVHTDTGWYCVSCLVTHLPAWLRSLPAQQTGQSPCPFTFRQHCQGELVFIKQQTLLLLCYRNIEQLIISSDAFSCES